MRFILNELRYNSPNAYSDTRIKQFDTYYPKPTNIQLPRYTIPIIE